MKISLSFGWKALAIAPVAVLVVLAGAWEGTEYYTSQNSFCGGSCHIMNEQYVAWQKSKHHALDGDPDKKAGCIDCHFLPGGKRTFKAKMQAARHLAAYLYDRDAPMPIRTVVKDGACLRSGCHAIEKFQDKEIKYGEKSTFKHKAHFEKEMLKGQKLFCDTCHMKYSAARHFETPKEICFACHFRPGTPREDTLIAGPPMPIKVSFGETAGGGLKNGSAVGFNTGPSKCSLCHTVPTKSLQQQLSVDDRDKKPITHQTLETAGVPCESCHLHEVAVSDEMKIDECLDCHSASAALTAKERDGKLMHDEHVAGRRADCLDCHRPSRHGALADYLDAVQPVCNQCHSDTHRFQRILLAGQRVSENISPVAGLMNAVRTNCAGCHTESKHSKGQLVKTGSAETCAKCHTPEHRKMLDDWKKTLEREVGFTKELEVEALEALAAAEDKLGADKLQEAQQMIATGQELLSIVQIGNGVHNKKYAIMILDEAIANFEDTIDLLDSGN
ncbi:MAG: NapC/NirT family cytochrome c [Alphaproteobacteria bacterium]|nr:NapC/NirT family cytochrome c [Alphaproteobacteria bacterium]